MWPVDEDLTSTFIVADSNDLCNATASEVTTFQWNRNVNIIISINYAAEV